MGSAVLNRFVMLTDIASSSRLAETYPAAFAEALERHNSVMGAAVSAHGGSVYKHTGDGFIALFETAGQCVAAAVEIAKAFAQFEPLRGNGKTGSGDEFLVRIALHGGELRFSAGEYYGRTLNRASRICQVISGGQVVLSAAVAAVMDGQLPEGVSFSDLGEHYLRDLAEPERLYQLEYAGFAPRVFPPLLSLNNRPNNLVLQPNSFIGRVRELEELTGLLVGGRRLISIVAPGGYGKSRLAAQLCANLLHNFENGVFMAYLAPLRGSPAVPGSIANTLSYQLNAGRTPEQQLCDYLRTKELLLCLDNFEHVMGSAALVAELLRAAPRLQVLITSREPLRIEGELVYKLEPLTVSQSAGFYGEAELLFADRAALMDRGFALQEHNRPVVKEVCAQLSGIPLALELAAAWVDGFTLAELRDELSHQLDLEARTSDIPERHRSLKACLDWSWNLLGAEQQQMLMRLSTFRGGFYSEAAGALLGIQGMVLRRALAKLCDKSWLYLREVDGHTRFFMRDMLAREYASAKLEETRYSADSLYEQATCAHAAYFAALVEREGPNLAGSGKPDAGTVQMAALRTWRTDLENIIEALSTARQRGEVTWLQPFAKYLKGFLEITGAYILSREQYEKLVAAAQQLGDPELLANSVYGLGAAHYRLGDYRLARELIEQSLAVCRGVGDRRGEATCLGSLALVYFGQGDFSRAVALESQSLAVCRQAGDRRWEGISLGNLAMVHYAQGDYRRAAKLIAQSLSIRRATGDRRGEAVALGNLALVQYALGGYTRAAELQEQALAIRREIGDRQGEAYSLNNLALASFAQGNIPLAIGLQHQALGILQEIGDRRGETSSLCNLASAYFAQGGFVNAARIQGQALLICRETGDNAGIAFCCALSAPCLAALGSWRPAAVALYGGVSQASTLNYGFEPNEQRAIEEARARLDAAVVSGAITTDQMAQLKVQAEALGPAELADLVLAALEAAAPSNEGAAEA